jgi:uncharacterized protein YbbK (DUF523 family)
VLAGRARVRTADGTDATAHFLLGARRAVTAAREAGVVAAVLKDGSPSCATRFVHDGTFAGRRVPGAGLTAQMLSEVGIRVFSETEIEEAERWVAGCTT